MGLLNKSGKRNSALLGRVFCWCNGPREIVGFLCNVEVGKPGRGDHAPAVVIAFTAQWAFQSRLKIATSRRDSAPAPNAHMVLPREAPIKTRPLHNIGSGQRTGPDAAQLHIITGSQK